VLLAILWTFFVIGGAFTQPASFWNKAMNTIEITLYADTRKQMAAAGTNGLAGSALLGVVFAAGWSPCIGPTLGAAMTLAAQQDVGTAIFLITAYCLGLGIPFLITALMLDSAQGILRRLNKHMNKIKVVSGIILIAIGFLVASGQLQQLSASLSGSTGGLAYTIDECLYGVQQGEIGGDQVNRCINGENYDALKDEFKARSGISQPEASLPVTAGSLLDTASRIGEIGLGIGQIAPDFSTTTPSGDVIRLNDLRGKTVLLNFWFVACPPCRSEMPAFQSVYESAINDDFVVLAINSTDDNEAMVAFAEEFGLTFPLLTDSSGALLERYNVLGFPTTYLIDGNGTIIQSQLGPLSEEKLSEWISALAS
jgi:peroxiredoxin